MLPTDLRRLNNELPIIPCSTLALDKVSSLHGAISWGMVAKEVTRPLWAVGNIGTEAETFKTMICLPYRWPVFSLSILKNAL